MFENMNQNPFMMADQTGFIDIDNNAGNIDIDLNQSQTQSQMINNGPMMMGSTSAPVIEPMRERVVNRTIEHVVPQE